MSNKKKSYVKACCSFLNTLFIGENTLLQEEIHNQAKKEKKIND